MQTHLEAALAKLISIPSITTNSAACREIIEYVRTELEPLGLFIHDNFETPNPWLYATTRDTKEVDILLAAHLDVVPAPDELFTMQKENDNLYGRGVYDMKLAAACYLELLKAHASELKSLNIGVLFTTDEEGGGLSVADVLNTGLRAKAVFLPDGGDNWHVEKRAKGLHGIQLTARGKTAHGSRPWEGENALHALLDVVHILRSKYPGMSPSDSTLTVNKLRAGEAVNQLADYASVMIDFRSFSKEDLANYRRLVAELAKKHNLEVTVLNTGEPLAFDDTAPGVQSFLTALRSYLNTDEIPYCESYGSTDARYFAEYNIPCIIMEPSGGGRHAPDEWLRAGDLEKYCQLLEQWIFPQTVTAVPAEETVAALA